MKNIKEILDKIHNCKTFRLIMSSIFTGSMILTILWSIFGSIIWFLPLIYFIVFWSSFGFFYCWIFEKSVKGFSNILDDVIDMFKEWLHCHPLPFGYQLNISFMMMNRKTTWDIIRKQGKYDNCDPDD
jgi:hypothetical protein